MDIVTISKSKARSGLNLRALATTRAVETAWCRIGDRGGFIIREHTITEAEMLSEALLRNQNDQLDFPAGGLGLLLDGGSSFKEVRNKAECRALLGCHGGVGGGPVRFMKHR